MKKTLFYIFICIFFNYNLCATSTTTTIVTTDLTWLYVSIPPPTSDFAGGFAQVPFSYLATANLSALSLGLFNASFRQSEFNCPENPVTGSTPIWGDENPAAGDAYLFQKSFSVSFPTALCNLTYTLNLEFDDEVTVWINGNNVTQLQGTNVLHSINVTSFIQNGNNTIDIATVNNENDCAYLSASIVQTTNGSVPENLTINSCLNANCETAVIGGSVLVDANGQNIGSITNSLKFGECSTGEAIASNRANSTAGENQNGLDFYTGFNNRMSITNHGGVGIGTTNPHNNLDVSGGVVMGSAYAGVSTSPANGLLIQGNVGIGTTTPANKLDVNGGIAIGAAYAGVSTSPANGVLIQGSVGIGTNTPIPNAKVDIFCPGIGASGSEPIALNILNTYRQGSGTSYGCNILTDGPPNIGIVGTGVHYGLHSGAENAQENIGVAGYANVGGTGKGKQSYSSFTNIGVAGTAYDAHICYGIYGAVMGIHPTSCAGYFDGDVYTTNNYYHSSDERLKTNIKNFQNGLDLLKQLNVKTYDFKYNEFKNTMNLPETNQIGIMAQNLQKVFPSLVKEKVAIGHRDEVTGEKIGDDVSLLAVNYTGLIPVLIEAVEELSDKTDSVMILKTALDNTNAQIANLQQQINDICSGGCASLKGGGSNDQSTAPTNQLLQNVPNPFSKTTSIGYVINSGTSAFINVNGLDGKLIKHYDVDTKGAGQISISASELNAGTYTYTLYVDSNVVDTKLMVITASN